MVDRIGRYQVVRPLGSGGMGEVFLAHDEELERHVALKRLLPEEDDGRRRILKEARAVARLSHPCIAQLFDVVEHDGVVHLVMEYVEGDTLASLLARAPLPETRVREIGRQMADALAFAHERGVVHCDIKPSNVMVTQGGAVKVLDFGVARIEATTAAAAKATTSSGRVRGTPPYTAPEVLLGETPTARSDIYSLGVTLFEALSGRRPFEGREAARLLEAASPPPSVRHLVPGVSAGMDALLARALAGPPLSRPASAGDVRGALDALTPSAPARASRPLVFSMTGATLALACLLLVTTLGTRPTPAASEASAPVLGVLVTNGTGDQDNDYLSAGIAETLVSRLAGTRGLAVVPTAAAAEYRGRPDPATAVIQGLGLTHVVSGSLHRSGDRLRVSLSLAARNQRVVWGTVIDGSAGDLLALEQGATDAVLSALKAAGMTEAAAAARQVAGRPTLNEEAFEQYSHGRAMLSRADVEGNLDRAVAFFERATAIDPGFVWARAALGEAAWQKYRATRDARWISRARTELDAALTRTPDDPTVLQAVAVLEHGTGLSDQALGHLEQVIARQPSATAAFRLRARIRTDRGDLEGAIADLREANRLHQDDPSTVATLGQAYFRAGRSNEAIASFIRLTTLQPDNASGFQMLGTAYHAAGDLDRALVSYERANAILPRASAHSNIGTIHYARGDYERAAASYRAAIAIQPKEPATHRNLADALIAGGNDAAAQQEYAAALALAQEALRVNPANARVLALAGLCESRLGRHAAAAGTLAKALALAPTDSEIVYNTALIALSAGQFERAVTQLRRALEVGYSRSMAQADREWRPVRARPDVMELLGPA